MIKTLTCIDCRVEFTYDHRQGPTRQRCDPCAAERNRQMTAAKARRWRDANRERAREQWNRSNRKRLADPAHLAQKRDYALRRAYGLTRAELDAMVAAQGGVCAICKGPPNGPGTRLHVDHCHNSSKVRGLLCAKCNTLVGLADDDPDRLERAAAYLRRKEPRMANSPSHRWTDGVLTERAISTDVAGDPEEAEATATRPYKEPVPTKTGAKAVSGAQAENKAVAKKAARTK